jgi:hypothetical protein
MLGALIGCADEPTEPAVPGLCEDDVAITVGTGVTPRFEWSPACRVTVLEVQNTETNTSAWTVLGFSPGGIVPPVTYGTAPPRAINLPDEETLETGTSYILVLSVIDILAGEYEVGRREFTP